MTKAEGQKRIKELLAECAENFEGMDMALRNAPQDKKTAMRTRIGACRELVDKLRVEMLVADKDENEKKALLGEDDANGVYLDMRGADAQQLQQEQVALLKRGEDHLHGALRDATEMQDVAIAIGQDLSLQREKIEGMKDRLVDINADIDRSDSLMRQMYRRMMFNKIAFGVGATAVVSAVSLVVLRFVVPWG